MKKIIIFLCALLLSFCCSNIGENNLKDKAESKSKKYELAYLNRSNGSNAIGNQYDYTIANVNVLNYGADNTGVNDSTNAFRQAIAQAAKCRSNYNTSGCDENSGGTVYVPPGKYKITGQLELTDHISLIGKLTKGDVNASDNTVLKIYYGHNETTYSKAAIKLGSQSAVKNIAFWYPNQNISSGNAIKYPPTIWQNGAEGVTLENLIFVNPYIAMDFASGTNNNSIQFLKDIYGTPLQTGIIANANMDTMKVENLRFSPVYWQTSSFNAPNAAQLANLLKNSTNKPSAIIMERVDWYMLSNMTINGYYNGILLRTSSLGNAEGEVYDANITNCTYPIRIENSRHMAITRVTLSSTGGNALYIKSNTNVLLNSGTLTSTGSNTISMLGTGKLSITNSNITGHIYRTNSNAKIALAGNTLSGTGFDNYNATGNVAPASVNYSKVVTTKPGSSNVVSVTLMYQLQSVINSLHNSGGGIVYIPPGIYDIPSPITIKSGVELRGSTPWAHKDGGTIINTTYRNGPIFVLEANSGINGITIKYPNVTNPYANQSKNYAIQGKGANVYIMNMAIINSWKGIDLKTYRCDNHYVRGIWASFLEQGISVGAGSTNGIIRDNHLTLNAIQIYGNDTVLNKNIKYTAENGIPFSIGNSNGEILFNNFTWGPNIGFDITNGASNVRLIAAGADRVNKGIRFSGVISQGSIINPLLVTKDLNQITMGSSTINLNITVGNNRYIETDSSYQGYTNIVNSMSWGNSNAAAYLLKGNGDIHINGGMIDNGHSPIVQNRITAFSTFGLMFNQASNVEIENGTGSQAANFVCPICTDGTCNVNNQANINFGLNNSCVK